MQQLKYPFLNQLHEALLHSRNHEDKAVQTAAKKLLNNTQELWHQRLLRTEDQNSMVANVPEDLSLAIYSNTQMVIKDDNPLKKEWEQFNYAMALYLAKSAIQNLQVSEKSEYLHEGLRSLLDRIQRQSLSVVERTERLQYLQEISEKLGNQIKENDSIQINDELNQSLNKLTKNEKENIESYIKWYNVDSEHLKQVEHKTSSKDKPKKSLAQAESDEDFHEQKCYWLNQAYHSASDHVYRESLKSTTSKDVVNISVQVAERINAGKYSEADFKDLNDPRTNKFCGDFEKARLLVASIKLNQILYENKDGKLDEKTKISLINLDQYIKAKSKSNVMFKPLFQDRLASLEAAIKFAETPNPTNKAALEQITDKLIPERKKLHALERWRGIGGGALKAHLKEIKCQAEPNGTSNDTPDKGFSGEPHI